MVSGAVIVALLFGWMALRSEDTATRLQSLIPVKTAVLEVPEVKDVASTDPNAPVDSLKGSKNINALPPAPIDGLTENKDGKFLPMSRVADDMTPFQAYKKPFALVAGKTLVSFVIVDYGLSDLLAQSVLDNLPPEISLVLTPYASDPSKWAASARAYGHEFWLALPMQTKDFGVSDSGPETLLVDASADENQRRLFDVLGTVVGYAGIVSEKNHVFSQDKVDVGPMMKQIFGRGLGFAESNPGAGAVGLSMAMEFGYPYAQNNLWLDADLRPEAIDRALTRLEIQSTRTGRAVVFLHPYPVVVKKLQEWIKGADAKNIQIAPLSALVQ